MCGLAIKSVDDMNNVDCSSHPMLDEQTCEDLKKKAQDSIPTIQMAMDLHRCACPNSTCVDEEEDLPFFGGLKDMFGDVIDGNYVTAATVEQVQKSEVKFSRRKKKRVRFG